MTALLVLALLGADPDPTPAFEADLSKKKDTFEAKSEKGAAVWTIGSGTGIGRAAVRLAKGVAPKRIVIRFPGLRNLEEFKIEAGKSSLALKLGEGVKDGKVSAVAGKIEGGVEVVIDHKDPPKEWKLSWINEFRR
ncbi:MAG: hypothetical protein K2W96_21560 [Gemmataceae bacterium]|nr:hypothetical protein [Gemmataceae bacterium]